MLYQQLPHQRKLSEFEKVEATRLLSMKANKKIVLSSMASQSGKVIILKDLSNLMRRDKGTTRNDLSTVVQMLNEKHGKIVVCF